MTQFFFFLVMAEAEGGVTGGFRVNGGLAGLGRRTKEVTDGQQ